MTHETSDNDLRLSQIQTNWTEVFVGVFGNQTAASSVGDAQRDLLIQYAGPVYRYLCAAVHDQDVADDLAQEFAFRIIRGDFRNADPQKGRFRDFIKQSLRNLVTDHFRRKAKSPLSLTPEFVQLVDPTQQDSEDDFDRRWRREVLAQTWVAMDHADREKATSYAVVLRTRATHPDAHSVDLAELVGRQLDRDVNAAWLRQNLHRARLRFNQLLRLEVQRTVGSDAPDLVDSELADLGLLKYTRD